MPGKTAVAGAKDRDTGRIHARVVPDTRQATLQGFVADVAAPGATVYTDEARAYLGMPFNHEAVGHNTGEFVRGMAHTNGMESFWSMLKRGYVGTFHKLSPKHLDRYVTEFAERQNTRNADTIDQMVGLVTGMYSATIWGSHLDRRAAGMDGKRLRYTDLIVGRRADWTPIGALTSCFEQPSFCERFKNQYVLVGARSCFLTHRGQHRALNNTDRRGNPLIWLDCGGQQSVLDNKPGCTRWRARSGSRHGRRERDLAGGVGAARPVSIAVSMTFPMRSTAASTSRSLTWA